MAAKIKSNIELRFFLDPLLARKIKEKWKKEGYKISRCSFLDLYYVSDKTKKKLAKIRKWRSPKLKTEIIFFRRDGLVKSETRKKVKSFKEAVELLEKMGYSPYLQIDKKKIYVFSNKNLGKSYVLENIKNIGWSGEVEIPPRQKDKLKAEIEYLKSLGIKSFTLSPMLQIMEQKLGITKPKKPKIYRYSLLKI